METMPRGMRIPDDVWFPALARARSEGTTLTAVVIAFLRKYGRSTTRTTTPKDETP